MRGRAAIALLMCIWAQSASAQTPAALTADDLFDGGTLHEIWLRINARDWDQLRARYMENTYYPCDVEWLGTRAFNAGCRSRGLGSRSGTKPGLKVDFDHYVGGQQFLGLTSLVLDNFWQDPSMIKERLSMLLFRRMGLAAPREAHARVFVGSGRDLVGLYAVVEDIDGAFLTRQFGSDTGHLYEYQWRDEYHFEDLGPNLEPYAARFEPRNHENDSAFTLYAPIRDMVRAVIEASPSDLEDALAPYLDLRGFLAHLAAENFLSEWDGLVGYVGLNNFYLYRPDGRSAQIIAWDKDSTFMWLDMPPWHNLDTNLLAVKAWLSPTLRFFYLQKLVESAGSSDWLEEEASREYAQIHEAALQDPMKPVSNDEFEQAVMDVIRFARERGAVVRRFAAQLAAGLLP